jgi:hypothetical protein
MYVGARSCQKVRPERAAKEQTANTIPQLNFGEGAINLSRVLEGLGEPCKVFTSTWMHSRSSSSSENAALKDYVGPRPLTLDTCKALPLLSSSASGAVNRRARGPDRAVRHRRLHTSNQGLRTSSSAGAPIYDVAHLSGGTEPTGTITFRLYGPNDATCAGAPVFTFTSEVLGNGYYKSGEFTPKVAGTYRWVVDYSGDQKNNPAGPTGCGAEEETVVSLPPRRACPRRLRGWGSACAAGIVVSLRRRSMRSTIPRSWPAGWHLPE